MKIEDDHNYIDGVNAANTLNKFIHTSMYNSIDDAIISKTEVVKHFETVFDYTTADATEYDRNYSFNVGMLNRLKEIKNE